MKNQTDMTKNYFIRHLATVLLGCILCVSAYSQHSTEFQFTETAPDHIRNTMQTNATAVFTAINTAYEQNKSGLSLSLSNITDDASKRIQTLWATSHFYCTKTYINTRVLKSPNAYQVRNIPVFFKEGKSNEDKYQNLVVEFTTSGKISDIYIAIAPHQYAKIMENANEVSDLRHRQIILDLVENFRTAYNRKDMQYLKEIYSDDALIITGKVLTSNKQLDSPIPTFNTKTQIEYKVQNKKQYLGNLQRVFNTSSYINIKFDEIVVTRHEGNPNIYGVTLKQNWNSSSGYHDEGWLFLMIDYENEDKPLIWVRTWQPITDPHTGKTIRYNIEDIFGLGNFPVR